MKYAEYAAKKGMIAASDITVTYVNGWSKKNIHQFVFAVLVDGYESLAREYRTRKGAAERVCFLLNADHAQISDHGVQVFAADGGLVFDKNIVGVGAKNA